ncbi:FHA domain-containing protein [Nannocystis bainbridge]|uniref:FHA domain-containing protein n=1 Tax=Nannocystis bainbridge TaxID=2995303 RepID=A0ABT5DSP2_9BACT|nr:FHA domain-containing protein [Nannocystis bainbridge]MDC0716652.1 FHA domain-containing protein [Nannocystis bainbridge]
MAEEPRRIAEYLRLDDERPFIHKAFDQTLGDADRLAYAALVEGRDPERAEWLRLEVALHSKATDDPAVLTRFVALAREIGRDYADALLREAIMNCGSEGARQAAPRVRFAFACPKRWETLAPSDSESVRMCQQCNERVYYCETVADAEVRAFAGQCIAIPKPLTDGGVRTVQLGRPDPVRDWADRLFSYGPGAPKHVEALVVLYSLDTELVGRSFMLNPAGVTVGRGLDNTIVLGSDSVSRCHARLEPRDDGWWVVDNHSTNGTYVHDEQVEEARLATGDLLKIGSTVFKFVGAPA